MKERLKALKVAVSARFELMETTSGLSELVRSPLQPAKDQPGSGLKLFS